MIEAHSLSKHYCSFAAVHDLTFQIGAGEVVAFLGPNGAGKSTTMKLLTGYLAATSGTAKHLGFGNYPSYPRILVDYVHYRLGLSQ